MDNFAWEYLEEGERCFLFKYRYDGGADFSVQLYDVNMNKAIEQFAQKYHSIDKVYYIDEITDIKPKL